MRSKVAIVGTGVAGLGAAWALNRDHDITLFEAADRIGGHANTALIEDAGRQIPVDTGFIVYNEVTYPKLTRLFRELQVPTEESEMSFAVSLGEGAIEYSGSWAGLLAQPGNFLRPRFWRMLKDITKFYREAPKLLDRHDDPSLSLGDYLRAERYSDALIYDHLLPMGAAIWSTSVQDMLAFPARSFVQFCRNHGLLLYSNRPQWRTVAGGSRTYVKLLTQEFRDRIRLNEAVTACRRTPTGVVLSTGAGREERFDQLVLACHSDQALEILGDQASQREREILGALGYEDNVAILHRDAGLMPKRKAAWASWNYLGCKAAEQDRKVSVTYWMNRLQNLETDLPVFVSLNPIRPPAEDKTIARFSYAHPQFDLAALQAQRQLCEIQGRMNTWFCGAYCGYGFHEDGLEAGLAVASELGAQVPWVKEVGTMSPAGLAVRPARTLAAAE